MTKSRYHCYYTFNWVGRIGGVHVQYVYFTEDEKKSRYSAVLTKFQSHYVPKLNVTYERHKLFSRNRQPGESIDRYVKDLRILSKTCEFGILCESLIKDQLVCGVNDARLTERLLRISDLDLNKALEVCRAAEASQEQLHDIGTVNPPEYHVEALSTRQKQQQPTRNRSPEVFLNAKCSRCGYQHGPKRCPATGKTCHRCKGAGHFSHVCRTKSVKVQALQTDTPQSDEHISYTPLLNHFSSVHSTVWATVG